MTTLRALVLAAALAALALFGRAAADGGSSLVRLRESAAVGPGQAVLLRDVAELSGPLALAQGSLVVVPAAARAGRSPVDVAVADLRRALSGAKCNLGLVAIEGSVCRVFEPAPPPPEAPSPPPAAQPPAPAPGPTIRERVFAVLASHLRAAPEDLELKTDPSDAPLLDAPLAGRRVEAAPEAAPESPRIPVRVRVYDGALIAVDRSVRVDVRVRTVCVVAKSPIRKGQSIEESMVALEPVWRSPGSQAATDIGEVVGRKSLARVEEGALISPDMVRSPVVVRRNELVQVRCLSGGVILTARARAGSDAATGEMVDLKLEGASRTFRGRVIGPGAVVVDLDGGDGADEAGAAPRLLSESPSDTRSRP
jgi:flagella basal body P-ring formation protein FlgA